MKVFLDSSPTGLITHPKSTPAALSCRDWLRGLVMKGHQIILPEIIDYEIRRELIRIRSHDGLRRLDALKAACFYLPLDTASMLKAASLWAEARQRGQPTAPDPALDVDVILASQASLLCDDGTFGVIATENQKHLSQFVPAENWRDIHPL